MIAHQYKKYYFYRDVIILDFKIVLKLALYNIVEKPNVGVSTVQAKLTVKWLSVIPYLQLPLISNNELPVLRK